VNIFTPALTHSTERHVIQGLTFHPWPPHVDGQIYTVAIEDMKSNKSAPQFDAAKR
jgi:hypothetical protein